MDWLWSNAISLMWMVVVIIAVFIMADGIAMCGQTSEDKLKRRAEENARLQRESEERQQEYWKERHKHENPQCEVCKEEEERKKRYDKFMNTP